MGIALKKISKKRSCKLLFFFYQKIANSSLFYPPNFIFVVYNFWFLFILEKSFYRTEKAAVTKFGQRNLIRGEEVRL